MFLPANEVLADKIKRLEMTHFLYSLERSLRLNIYQHMESPKERLSDRIKMAAVFVEREDESKAKILYKLALEIDNGKYDYDSRQQWLFEDGARERLFEMGYGVAIELSVPGYILEEMWPDKYGDNNE